MVAKSQIKLIKSLYQKKYRNQHGLFVAEGTKMVEELLSSSINLYQVYTTDPDFFRRHKEKVTSVSERILQQMSNLKSPNKVLGVFYVPEPREVDYEDWILVLDDVRDPGNLGTIIRLCDWFGVRHLVCSPKTVDCYNPKTLQATMGSIARMHLTYTPLKDFLLEALDRDIPIYGSFMDGTPIRDSRITGKGILVMGNEAHGIGAEVASLCTNRLAIPRYGGSTVESLNVATATAILLHEVRRG